MKITPELSALKNAYMKARNEKDTAEMSRLKSKAMVIKNNQKNTSIDEKLDLLGEKDTKVLMNNDGDSFELSIAGKQLEESLENNLDNQSDKSKEIIV